MTDTSDAITLNDALSAASPLIEAIVKTYVTPKLEQFRDKHKDNKNISHIPTENHFIDYYSRTYKKLIVVNTIVFNNSQRLLSDIFLPLTLFQEKNDVRIEVNGYPSELSDEYGNILITDTAGMGKSTLMKMIFIDIVENKLGIPIFVELRRLNFANSLLNEIKNQLNAINKKFNEELLLELLAEGGFIIILDGYDEIPLSDKDVVTANIQDFIAKTMGNRYFLTSRPEQALNSFGSFQEFNIEPLSREDAFQLIKKYDKQGHIAPLLIKKLEEQELANISEFLTNPLLVSLLYTAFEYKKAIPFKKYLFYRQVYDANFESHDLTKGDSFRRDKYSKLEIDDFHRVLRCIGYDCFKLQRIEFSKDEILKLIKQSKEFCVGLTFNESAFLEDLLKTVPIFTQEGNDYRWSHKSLQEYFAAQFIYHDAKGKQDLILLMLYNHKNLERFINVLDLYYDMDYKSFRNVIEREFLREYQNFYDTHYTELADGVSKESVERRAELTFMHACVIVKLTSPIHGDEFDQDYFESVISKIDNRVGFPDGAFSFTSHDNYLCTYRTTDPKFVIAVLLYNKRSKLVSQLKDLTFSNKSSINIEFELEDEPILLTDEITNMFNTVENFDATNDLLQRTHANEFYLSHKRVVEQLRLINSSIENSKENDFLLDGFY